MKTTRAEHMKWCKARAMQYVEVDDLQQAVASMLSDITKHEETTGLFAATAFLAFDVLRSAADNDRRRVIDWINGFPE